MNYIKQLLTLAVLLVALPAMAETKSLSFAAGHGAAGSLITSNSVYVTGLQFANGTGGAVTVEVFDAPLTNVTFSVGAYTNYISYISNVVSTIVGYTGHTNLQTNAVLMHVPNAVSAATLSYKSLTKVTVPASSSLTVPINSVASYGILVTNNAAITVTLSYEKLLSQ